MQLSNHVQHLSMLKRMLLDITAMPVIQMVEYKELCLYLCTCLMPLAPTR